MIRRLFSALIVSAVVMAVPTTATLAKHEKHEKSEKTRRWIPEFDPAAVGAISALVIGGGVLVARRRRR